ncbi:MAG: hypothetical protein WB341_09220 [Terracidiphilus sp.]
MRQVVLALGMIVLLDLCHAQPEGARVETIILAGLETSAKCLGGPVAVLLDDSHLLVNNPIHCTGPGKFQGGVADLKGKIQRTLNSEGAFSAGPNGQLIMANRDGHIEILDQGLSDIADITFPGRILIHDESVFYRGIPFFDAIALSPDRKAFSICSLVTPLCKLFAGSPPTEKASLTLGGPFPGLTSSGFARLPLAAANLAPGYPMPYFYHPADDQTWFFTRNGNHLSRITGDGGTAELAEARWLTSRSDDNCRGEMSAVEPRRFLAECWGAHDLFGGDEMPIFPYRRIIVYALDGSILFKKSVIYWGTPSISPDGHLIAVSHGKKVDLYHLP